MKVKTSVTLSESLLRALSAETTGDSRSAMIEEATWEYLERRKRAARDKMELDAINSNADILNDEAHDALEYQGEV